MEITDQTANQTHNFYLKKTLQFLVPISIISFLVSYFSVVSLIFHPLQFYNSIFPSSALDRKSMFLLCNGILAFLAKNLKLNTSALNHGDHDHQLKDHGLAVFHEDAQYVDDQPAAALQEEIEIKVEGEQEQADDMNSQSVAEEIETEEWEDDDDDDEEVEESPSVVSDMRVSTEELNKKFDEFIRKMKEEIRIEARQQYLIAV